MYITLTSRRPYADQSRKLDTFLAGFLWRFERQPGVVAIYHYLRTQQGEDVTVVIWESQEAVQSYTAGTLFQEAQDIEKELHLPTTREGYPLDYASSGTAAKE